MDTKSKNNDIMAKDRDAGSRFKNQWPVMLVCLLVCALLSVAVLGYGAWAFKSPDRSYAKAYESSEFADGLYRDSYMLYWKLQQKELDDFTLSPAQVFFPSYRDTMLNASGIAREDYDTEEEYQAAVAGHTSYMEQAAGQFDGQLLDYMNTRSHEFDNRWNGTGYLALDLDTGAYIGTWNDELAALARGDASADTLANLQNNYAYYAVLRFGENGSLGVPAVYGAPQDTMDNLRTTDMEQLLLQNTDQYGYSNTPFTGTMQAPSNMAIVFPVPKGMVSSFYSNATGYDIDHMNSAGIPFVYYLAVFIAMGVAVLLWLRPQSPLRQSPAAKLPPEVSFIAICAVMGFYNASLEYSLMRLFRGDYAAALAQRGVFTTIGAIFSYGFFAAVLAAIFLVAMAAAASVMQIKELGFGDYIRERSLCMWFWRRFSTQIKAAWAWVTDIDLSEPGNRTIIKILAVNFVVLAFLCSIWFFGIFGLIVYTVILYFVLKKYADKLKLNYAKLLDATGQMAEGRLDVHIDQDLGVFTPLGQELDKVQKGFTVAVRDATKSQRMKTELISNVSHDLKTPLTAIITYVNLLKREDLTDEERQSYVATLDQKSQRLKHLIEDLFEMSKASSGDIVLHPTKVDLPALVRQVELEARDDLEAAGIEFRYNFPPGKVELLLDGEKTSRIFENLIMNVAKYGMPGTRAYVTIVAGEKLVTLEMKNISKNELTFDTGEITERFMRGDSSRSSDGSGLGLAIVKSFAEAQGAQFKIVTDGDMFKAYITFSRLPGVAVPRAAAPQPQAAPGADPLTAGFGAPSSSYKPPAAAFATGPVHTGQPGQPPHQSGTNNPFGQFNFNQVADVAVDVANQAVSAVASAARQVADKAKQATDTAKQATDSAKEQKRAAKEALAQAKQQAKDAARRMREEARQSRRDKRSGYSEHPYAERPYHGQPQQPQQPYWQQPYQGQNGPYGQASHIVPPPPAYTPYAPVNTPPPNPEPPPAEVLHPENLFAGIPDPAEAPRPELTLEVDLSDVPLPEPELTVPTPPKVDEVLQPTLELYPLPELLDDEDPA